MAHVTPLINIRNVRLQPPVAQTNRTGWFISIGTHKKPASDREFETLRIDLEEALDSMIRSNTFANDFLYNMVQLANGEWIDANSTRPFGRTDVELSITGHTAEFVVEKGSKTGRIDAHVLYEVDHLANAPVVYQGQTYRNNRIFFDGKKFRERLDALLETSNDLFALEGIYTDDISKTGQYLRWANPPLYVFWKRTTSYANNPVRRYMAKNNDPEMEKQFRFVEQTMLDRGS